MIRTIRRERFQNAITLSTAAAFFLFFIGMVLEATRRNCKESVIERGRGERKREWEEERVSKDYIRE